MAAAVGGGIALAGPPTTAVGADVASVGSDAGSRERAFAMAAVEFGVPQSVLEAVSYAQTRWDFHPGHSTSGGYGPMHLVDADLASDDARGLGQARSSAATTVDDTLSQAARLTGLDEDALRTDELANIRGGAALLAAEQHRLGLPGGASSPPGGWYASVAAASGSSERASASAFADDAFTVITQGAARHTVDGKEVALVPTAAAPDRSQLAKLGLNQAPTEGVECPTSVDCQWIPATYRQKGPNPSDYVNHDLANRPASPEITGIVIHNTEGSYASTIASVQDPTRAVSWQYTLRSSDGHIAQHVLAKDIAWQAGNWYVNSHSIGLEHEGFAASGAEWFSEPMYRASARLVKYLAAKYDIPIDRQHVYGHDQVPGTIPQTVATMHWDPGPYWDWEHYFTLLGAPLNGHKSPRSTDLVTILPGFDKNEQTVFGCAQPGVPCATQGTNFVYLHQAPSAGAPLIPDVGLEASGAPSTREVADIGARATAGVEYAVAERRGDWTAIWFNGTKGWFLNPVTAPTAVPSTGQYVVPKAGRASVPVYGRAYPEASAYPAGIPVQAVVPLQYAFAAGQRYAVGDLTVPTNYYRASTLSLETPNDHVDVVGQDRYYQISLGHRFAYVRAVDVDVVDAS